MVRIVQRKTTTDNKLKETTMQTISATTALATALASTNPLDADEYRPMLDSIRTRFGTLSEGPLFTTDVDGNTIWRTWLANLPAHERQHHTCHACRRFVESYGGLVRVDPETGTTTPVMFSPGMVGSMYDAAYLAVHDLVGRARITGVFLSNARVWGTPTTPDGKRDHVWHHMSVTPPARHVYRHSILSPEQKMAELREDYGMLNRALAEYSLETIATALSIVKSEALYQGEKVHGRLAWLHALAERRRGLKGQVAAPFIWLAVAMAPAGFAHVKSSVMGPLLDDLAAGKSFDEVKRAFEVKMNPLKYQRPQAPPSTGNIAQAEAIVEKLGIASSLRRRFARLEDLKLLWSPAPVKMTKPSSGVFGHLKPTPVCDTITPARGPVMTFAKFAAQVLPTAEKIEIEVPHKAHFHAFVTAVDPDAPPIFQWDGLEGCARNSVTWYTNPGGSYAREWNLGAGGWANGNTYTEGGWAKVNALSLMPNMWQKPELFKHHGEGVLFVIDGCRDIRKGQTTACLFPVLLKSELHSVRSTIEAYSNRATMEDAELASACGLTVRAGSPNTPIRVRVTAGMVATTYTIDRWD